MTLTLNLHMVHANGDPPAVFSADGRYRYQLTRCWDSRLPMLAVVGLNPSKAGASRNDSTVRNLVGLAEASGHGGFRLVNLYAGIDTHPRSLAAMDDPVGPDNDWYLRRVGDEHDLIVLAWGGHADPVRARTVAARLWRAVCRTGAQLGVWGWTANHQPHHPLYLPHSTPIQCLTGGAHPTFTDVDPRWLELVSWAVDEVDADVVSVGGQRV